MPHIWIIDDDDSLRWVLDKTFSKAGFSTACFEDAYHTLEALEALEPTSTTQVQNVHLPDVVLSDIRMPGMDGLALLHKIHALNTSIPVIVMTAHSDLDAAVDSYTAGAFEYLPKPFDLNDALSLTQKALTNTKNQSHAADAPTKPKAQNSTKTTTKNPPIIGKSAAMQAVFRAIGRLAKANMSVLINGESGTGKELIAQALHQHSPRKDKAFIALNMAAIPHDLIEAELFGHEKGAFTGANTLRKGRFEQADGGTLFLDEIGDMPFSTQTRLLRVLANGEFFRVGGQTPVRVDVRIIAATHQNLEDLVTQGKFREDLFYRLNVIRIPVPALRERPEDIPALAAHFLQTAAHELNEPAKTLTDDAIAALQAYEWKGNVRQLENVCRWITVMASSHQVSIYELPEDILPAQAAVVSETEISEKATSEATAISEATSSEAHKFTAHKPTTQKPTIPTNTNDIATWQTLLSTEIAQHLANGDDSALTSIMTTFESTLIQAALTHTKGRKGDAAKLLGWGRNTLTRKLQILAVENDGKQITP